LVIADRVDAESGSLHELGERVSHESGRLE
jgi:hypothetical protein